MGPVRLCVCVHSDVVPWSCSFLLRIRVARRPTVGGTREHGEMARRSHASRRSRVDGATLGNACRHCVGLTSRCKQVRVADSSAVHAAARLAIEPRTAYREFDSWTAVVERRSNTTLRNQTRHHKRSSQFGSSHGRELSGTGHSPGGVSRSLSHPLMAPVVVMAAPVPRCFGHGASQIDVPRRGAVPCCCQCGIYWGDLRMLQKMLDARRTELGEFEAKVDKAQGQAGRC